MYNIHNIIYKIVNTSPGRLSKCVFLTLVWCAKKELKRLRGEFQEAETAAATLEADMVHQEMSNRALVLLFQKMVLDTCW